MENTEIAQVFFQIADILEIKGENPFRIGAYRRAAQTIEALPNSINQIYRENKLEEIPGVGKGIAEKIKELMEKGMPEEFEKLKKEIHFGLLDLLKIEGIGPKTVQFFYKKFKIKSVEGLEDLIKKHKLRNIKGFGVKTEENILKGIENYKRAKEKFLLGEIFVLAENIVKKLKENKNVDQAEIAGSFRRRKEVVGDLDILAASKNSQAVMDFFVSLPFAKETLEKGKTKSAVKLSNGLRADLRVVKPESFGAALHYFTGSKAHNIRIRKRGMERGLKINEYGVFKIKDDIKISGAKEEDVFKAVGLPWIPPEIREDRGEIEAAQKGQLPKLLQLKDIKGDLHCHSEWSDGAHTIKELAEEAKKRGYQYLAITDHASLLGITDGLDDKRILAQIKEIEKLNKKIKGIRILKGVEVDILKDGSLYLSDHILKQLDIVVAAVHSGFKMLEKEMTERIIKAIKNSYVDIIAHPTGRLIGAREPYRVDLDKIFDEAKKYNKMIELNAFWTRLDLNDINLRKAKEKGLRIAINTDAHNKTELEVMKFGVDMARRGWLEKKDVVNALTLDKLEKILNFK